jgi:hypothetical protein
LHVLTSENPDCEALHAPASTPSDTHREKLVRRRGWEGRASNPASSTDGEEREERVEEERGLALLGLGQGGRMLFGPWEGGSGPWGRGEGGGAGGRCGLVPTPLHASLRRVSYFVPLFSPGLPFWVNCSLLLPDWASVTHSLSPCDLAFLLGSLYLGKIMCCPVLWALGGWI